MLDKVVSGGQVGADIAGVRAAKSCGIMTGGWLPSGRKTLDGRMTTDMFNEFGFVEHRESAYPARTQANVEMADATVRLAYNFSSPGELCTLRYIRKHNKPRYDVLLMSSNDNEWRAVQPYFEFASWLDRWNVKILNVAGNANKGIEGFVEDYLIAAFVELGHRMVIA